VDFLSVISGLLNSSRQPNVVLLSASSGGSVAMTCRSTTCHGELPRRQLSRKQAETSGLPLFCAVPEADKNGRWLKHGPFSRHAVTRYPASAA
jgi:hypothetical protein